MNVTVNESLQSQRTWKAMLQLTPHVYVSKRREIGSSWCTAHAQRRAHAATRTAERIGEEAQAGGVGQGTPRPLQHFRKSLPQPHLNSINKLEEVGRRRPSTAQLQGTGAPRPAASRAQAAGPRRGCTRELRGPAPQPLRARRIAVIAH